MEIKKFTISQEESLNNDPKIEWSASLISNKILDYIAENHVKAMIAYDEYGVNGDDKNVAIAKSLKYCFF